MGIFYSDMVKESAERLLKEYADHTDEARVVREYLALSASPAPAADDAEPVTPEWLRSLPGRVIDDSSKDSTLIQLDGNRFLVFESDGSMAVQEGMVFNDHECQYIPLELCRPKTRGDVRRLLGALGIPAKV